MSADKVVNNTGHLDGRTEYDIATDNRKMESRWFGGWKAAWLPRLLSLGAGVAGVWFSGLQQVGERVATEVSLGSTRRSLVIFQNHAKGNKPKTALNLRLAGIPDRSRAGKPGPVSLV